jgi:hypothetical protein
MSDKITCRPDGAFKIQVINDFTHVQLLVELFKVSLGRNIGKTNLKQTAPARRYKINDL